ncbi:MAG: protein arginine kinase [Planctomycetes bacterium]|nr:protein arginine kinase [Planctomycetota bacterium]
MSTRLRLARNIDTFPFKGKITDEEEARLEDFVAPKIVNKRMNGGLRYFKLNSLDELDRLLLLENHLISMEHLSAEGPRGVAFNESGSVSIMVNEEDHLRIQVIEPGLALEKGWKEIDRLEGRLGEALNWSFNERYGYLTSCPTNVGTGLRVSVMLHLPALVLSKHIEKVFNAVSQVNLVVRGFFGEGSQTVGDFFQISNQITLGMAPDEIIGTVTKVLTKIIEYERDVREALLSESRNVLEDKVWRAWGTLKSARSISSEEAMSYLSSVRLGVTLDLLENITLDTINKLFLDIQPGHLQKIEGLNLDTEARDAARANLIRRRLQELGHS